MLKQFAHKHEASVLKMFRMTLKIYGRYGAFQCECEADFNSGLYGK